MTGKRGRVCLLTHRCAERLLMGLAGQVYLVLPALFTTPPPPPPVSLPRACTQIVNVPGGPSHNNYGNVRLIVNIAQRSKVDAVWAGKKTTSEW